jgi:riboflavin kinase/FMN adenylyltransferase
MQVYRSSAEAAGALQSPAVAVGNFDGVHCAHQALFRRARELAGPGGQVAALTFSPHPARLFNPDLAPPLITTEEQKLEAMAQCGLDAVVLEPFSRDFAALPPEEFVRRILAERLGARHVIVGEGFLFGRKKAGTVETLQQLGLEHGFEAHAVGTIRLHSIVVSSTKIREFILLGKVGGASLLLGRDYLVEGSVIPGKARGRTIGIPTANVATDNEILPRKGVYAGWARLPDGTVHRAVINIGTNPTFEKADVLSLEAHLLDCSLDLYGQRLGIHFTQRLREEQRFGSVDELVEAIHADIADAREILKEPAVTVAPDGCGELAAAAD